MPAQRKLMALDEAREEHDKAYLTQVLSKTGGNISQAAALAGRYRAELYKMMRKYGINPADFKGNTSPWAPAPIWIDPFPPAKCSGPGSLCLMRRQSRVLSKQPFAKTHASIPSPTVVKTLQKSIHQSGKIGHP